MDDWKTILREEGKAAGAAILGRLLGMLLTQWGILNTGSAQTEDQEDTEAEEKAEKKEERKAEKKAAGKAEKEAEKGKETEAPAEPTGGNTGDPAGKSPADSGSHSAPVDDTGTAGC